MWKKEGEFRSHFLKISTLAAQSSVDSCLISYSEWYTACFLVNAKHELNKFDIAGNSRVWILDSNKLIKPVLLPSHWFSRVLLPSGHLPSEDGTVWDCVFNRRHPMAVWAARVSTFRLWTEAVTPGPTTDVFASEGGTKDRCCWPVSILGLHTNPLLCFLCLLTDFWHQICTLLCGTTSREEHIKPQCSLPLHAAVLLSLWTQLQHGRVWPFCCTNLYYVSIKSGFNFWSQQTENFVSLGKKPWTRHPPHFLWQGCSPVPSLGVQPSNKRITYCRFNSHTIMRMRSSAQLLPWKLVQLQYHL